jgi:hypothetical protein
MYVLHEINNLLDSEEALLPIMPVSRRLHELAFPRLETPFTQVLHDMSGEPFLVSTRSSHQRREIRTTQLLRTTRGATRGLELLIDRLPTAKYGRHSTTSLLIRNVRDGNLPPHVTFS